MRISGGGARGISLVVPKGDAVRPATDGMRQAVFSSLGERAVGACFLDLFAGSGAYGLEALSRGASKGVFIEKNSRAAACVRQNLIAVCKSLGRDTQGIDIIVADAVKASLQSVAVPDLVFIDPPYEIIGEVAVPLLERLSMLLISKPEALVIFEMPGEIDVVAPGWLCRKRLGKGARQPTVAFFQRVPLDAPVSLK